MATALTNEKPKNTYKDLFHLGAGNVGLTASTPQQGYDGLGNLTPFKMATDELQMTQPLTLANGVVGAPSLAWANSLTTGLYRSAADTIGVAVAGALDFSIAANTFNVLSGSDLDINSGATLSINGTLASALTVANGGTGAATLTDGGILLGSGGSAISAMAVLSDGEMIVGDGSGDPVAESGATLRTSIGVGTGDSPQFTGIELGHATDTTIARASSGDITIEGNAVYRAGGTDVAVADGGTGASDAATARTNLGLGTGGNPQFTSIQLGHASDTTIARVSAGVVSIEGGAIYKAGGEDVAVADGGTGVSSLTDGGVLLGSGGSAISAMAVLSDGEMIVGDGSGDPVAESGATLRTSIGVGTGDSPQFTGITGGLVFNETGADVDYRFEGDTDANVLWIDGGQDTIGIGRQPSSTSTLYVGAGATQDTQYNVMDFGCYGTDPTLQVGGFSVSTSAVEIHDHLSGGVSGGLCLITGGTDPHTFTDLVLWHSQGATTPIVIASKEKNTPSARTYAHSSGYLTVQIATGTVTMTALGFSMRSN